jgi:hypothetical protein
MGGRESFAHISHPLSCKQVKYRRHSSPKNPRMCFLSPVSPCMNLLFPPTPTGCTARNSWNTHLNVGLGVGFPLWSRMLAALPASFARTSPVRPSSVHRPSTGPHHTIANAATRLGVFMNTLAVKNRGGPLGTRSPFPPSVGPGVVSETSSAGSASASSTLVDRTKRPALRAWFVRPPPHHAPDRPPHHPVALYPRKASRVLVAGPTAGRSW